MWKKIVVLLVSVVVLSGCGGGGADVFVDDPFFDDFGADLIAVNDQYSTFQNRTLSVGDSNGLLSNDFICCPDFDLIVPTTTASGGTVVSADDGSFVYTPPRNFTGTDFFIYRLEDEFGSSEAEVNISVNEAPIQGFFVDNQSGSDSTGSGLTGTPFATIQGALDAAGPNGTVIVRAGSGTPYTGTLTMQDGQTLVGEDFQQVAAQGVVRPTLSGPILMGDACTVRGLTIDGNSVDGVGRVGGEISQCDIRNSSTYALELDGATGSWKVEDNILEDSAGGVAATTQGSEELQLKMAFNTIRNNTFSAVLLTSDGSSNLKAALYNSVLSGHQAGFTFEAEASSTSQMCLDLEQNENDDTYRLTRNGALFQVEQFPDLASLNTGTITVPADAIQNIGNGQCGF